MKVFNPNGWGHALYPPQARHLLKIRHHLHSSYEKSMIERTIQFIKGRTEEFDEYFPFSTRKIVS